MITVLIAEDYALLRSLYAQVLAADPAISCVGQAAAAAEALALAEELRPNVALVDISLPDGNGLDLARAIKLLLADCHVVILGEKDNEEYRAAAKASGASAYLQKEQTTDQLVPLVRLLGGQPVVRHKSE